MTRSPEQVFAPSKNGVSKMGKAILGLLLVIVSACIPTPRANLIVSGVTPASARIDAELASVSVEPASRDRDVPLIIQASPVIREIPRKVAAKQRHAP
jgi:hypothetical protein